jgi:catechol 2,3-dioxygenase-like lactoylglutathione lyase family enzyme
MLGDKKLKAFIPTIEPEKSKEFYIHVLGLKLISEDYYGMEFYSNGTLLRINLVNKLSPQPFTVLGWDVEDLPAMIGSLSKAGVIFERYNFIEQDAFGIWTAPGGVRVAWFKDPDGNLLSLTEHDHSITDTIENN